MRLTDERASALMLVPAGVLVLLVLAAIAIDSAAILLAQRELANQTAAVANDITTLALDDDALYGAGTVTIDAGRASEFVERALATPPQGARSVEAAFEIAPDGRTITISTRAEVPWFFARVLPTADDVAVVEAVSTATLT